MKKMEEKIMRRKKMEKHKKETVGAYHTIGITSKKTSNLREQKDCKGKGKVFLSTGLGGPWGCERLRLLHFLENRLSDGGKVVSPSRRPIFTPQEDSWYSFLLEAESTPGP
jgi:hypothetical protein